MTDDTDNGHTPWPEGMTLDDLLAAVASAGDHLTDLAQLDEIAERLARLQSDFSPRLFSQVLDLWRHLPIGWRRAANRLTADDPDAMALQLAAEEERAAAVRIIEDRADALADDAAAGLVPIPLPTAAYAEWIDGAPADTHAALIGVGLTRCGVAIPVDTDLLEVVDASWIDCTPCADATELACISLVVDGDAIELRRQAAALLLAAEAIDQ